MRNWLVCRLVHKSIKSQQNSRISQKSGHMVLTQPSESIADCNANYLLLKKLSAEPKVVLARKTAVSSVKNNLTVQLKWT